MRCSSTSQAAANGSGAVHKGLIQKWKDNSKVRIPWEKAQLTGVSYQMCIYIYIVRRFI